MIRQLLLALIGIVLPFAADADETVTLKCIYNGHPWMREHGRHVLATLDGRTLRFVDNYQGGQNTTDFVVTRIDETEVEGRKSNDPDTLFSLSRLTGRLVQKTNCTADAHKLWNNERQKIGFDLAPNQILWCTVDLDCQKVSPIF